MSEPLRSVNAFYFISDSLHCAEKLTVPVPVKFKAPFCPGSSYHLLFKSIDGLSLFQTANDYLLFLQQFSNYFHPVLNTLAYNLLGNHSHFIVQIKERRSLVEHVRHIPANFRTSAMNKVLSNPVNDTLIDIMIERQANSFMTSFVSIQNKLLSRKGGIFQSPFRRSIINDDVHLQQAIIYVHANAQKHGIVKDFKDYRYSSYHEILSGYSANVCIESVLDFFGGKDSFIQIHKAQVDHFYANDWPRNTLECKA